MAALAIPLLPLDPLPSGTPQAQFFTTINLNSLRSEVIAKPALSFEASQPGAPVDGDLYVLSAAWGDEVAGTLAYYSDGTWYYFEPYIGQFKRIGADDFYTYDPDSSDEWQLFDPAGSAVTSVNGATGAVIVLVPIQIAVGDETTALTTGAAKVTFRMPFAMTLLAGGAGVRANVKTAPTDANLVVDINVTGTGSILSTPISIDATEKTSVTATTPPVISTSTLADDAEVTIDIDQIGSTISGAGLKVTLIGYKTP